MMGCVWHDSNLTAAYIGAQYFTRFPSQDPLHELGGDSRSVEAKRGESFRATHTGTPGDACFFSGLVLPFFYMSFASDCCIQRETGHSWVYSCGSQMRGKGSCHLATSHWGIDSKEMLLQQIKITFLPSLHCMNT